MSEDLSHELTYMLESAEAELYYACEIGAPPDTVAKLGISTARMGGGVVLSMREDPTGFWSKTLGLGVTEPVTATLMDEIFAFYRAQGAPSAIVQIAPSALPPDWTSIAAEHGLVGGADWLKLAAPIDGLNTHVRRASRLRVEPVQPEQAEEWARVVLRGFGMPEDLFGPMLAAYVENPGFTAFAAWDGDEIVAGANLFVHGPVGSLNTASTLPGHERRGAQSALIAARIAAADEAGCTWVIAETGKPRPGTANHSLANLRHAGLRPIYARRNWRWTDPAARPAA